MDKEELLSIIESKSLEIEVLKSNIVTFANTLRARIQADAMDYKADQALVDTLRLDVEDVFGIVFGKELQDQWVRQASAAMEKTK